MTFPCIRLAGQVDNLVSCNELDYYVRFLSGELCDGRGAQQRGLVEAAFWVERQFRRIGLQSFYGDYCMGFSDNGKSCHNVVGLLPARKSDKYMIVAAHYDNLGTINGKTYPGADSNASGVAAMLSIARMFKHMRDFQSIGQNIIFVALDGKQLNLAGSRDLWKRISEGELTDPFRFRRISPDDITAFVNLDILGGTSAPIHKGREDYLIVLGAGEHGSILQNLSTRHNLGIEVGYDYYGSQNFTDLFLKRVSDQKIFLEKGIYSVMFTSGITMTTNRDTDLPETINLPVLEKRTKLIFHWLDKMTFILH